MSIQDIISVFKKWELPLIDKYEEAEHVYTFLFAKEKDLTWKAGQHGLFKITHRKIKNPIRPFSVASAPAEEVVKITIGISDEPSDFKQAMLELQQGMKVSMSGPVGGFYLKNNVPTLLIAGGIGITPFRSIVKQIEAERSRTGEPIHLLYIDSSKSYLFKDELDALAQSNVLRVVYLDAREDLQQEINRFNSLYQDNGQYFIAGPKAMTEAIAADLRNSRISKRNIKKDAFFGYESIRLPN